MINTNFLTEDNGSDSLIRLICVIAMVCAVFFGVIAVIMHSDIAKILASDFMDMTLFAIAGKVIQKPFEQKVKQDSLDPKDVDDLK